MVQYLECLEHVLKTGTPRHGEKPDGTLSIWGYELKFDLSKGFPLLTCRDLTKLWDKWVTREPLWMLSGSTNTLEAERDYGFTGWNPWAEESRIKIGTPPGELGYVYGQYLRHHRAPKDDPKGGIDQMTQVIEMMRRTPETRRAVINLYDLPEVELDGKKFVNIADCISMLHFSRTNYKLEDGSFEPRLDMAMTHRSADIPAGVPSDIAGWAVVQMLMSTELGIPPGTLVDHIEDGQIYEKQLPKVKRLLDHPDPKTFPLPTVTIDNNTPGQIYNHKPEDFHLNNYQHGEELFMPTAK